MSSSTNGMSLKHANQPVYRLRFINSTDLTSGMQPAGAPPGDTTDGSQKKQRVKSFLDPDESTFANIRKRLSTLSLSTGYQKSMDTNRTLPVMFEQKLPPRRLGSINSKDSDDKNGNGISKHKPRVLSRTSFFSDDRETRNSRHRNGHHKGRTHHTGTLPKVNDNFLTPSQDPELFSRHIRLKDKQRNNFPSRSTSPKSFRSQDSSGKVHLGLIESLDLNEHLHDVEKIKARYSTDQFMTSLSLYKLRGHVRCHFPEVDPAEYISRGTRQPNPEMYRLDVSPYKNSTSDTSINTIGNVEERHEWKPAKSYVKGQGNKLQNANNRCSSGKASVKSKKSVGFNMTPLEISESEDETPSPASTRREPAQKRPKSILKRPMAEWETSSQKRNNTGVEDPADDEFLNNAHKRWTYHLPKIHSPVQSAKAHRMMPFRNKMYHFGDGVSREFEQVINRYGNCRQNSMVRDQSFVRETSKVKDA